MQALTRSYSVADYLALDAGTESERYEYWDGDIVAMAGAQPLHNVVAANVLYALLSRLRDRGCYVVQSDQRVSVEATKYGYPDVVATCAERLDLDRSTNPPTLRNPELLVEVTSDSTRRRDFEQKAPAYLALDSVQEYWIASAAEPLVVQMIRQGEQTEIRYVRGADGVLHSEHFGVEIPLEEIYGPVWRRVQEQEADDAPEGPPEGA